MYSLTLYLESSELTYLTVTEQLVPFFLSEWLVTEMAEKFAIDSVDPHVVVVWVHHKVEHVVAINVSEQFEGFPHS